MKVVIETNIYYKILNNYEFINIYSIKYNLDKIAYRYKNNKIIYKYSID